MNRERDATIIIINTLTNKSAIAKCISIVLIRDGCCLRLFASNTNTVMFAIAENTISTLYTVIDSRWPSLNCILIGRWCSGSEMFVVSDQSSRFRWSCTVSLASGESFRSFIFTVWEFSEKKNVFL